MKNNRGKMIKVLIWRLISILITLTVMAITTGDIIEASAVTAVLHILLVVCHYFFEISWGKRFEAR